jgi:phenylacetate-CoA ligase
MLGEVIEFAKLLSVRWQSANKLEVLRLGKLKHVVRHAYEQVPYYRARMESAGIRPEDIATLEDLRRLPVTTKDDLRQAGDTALSAGAAELITLHTTGYSGKPFAVRLTPNEYRRRRLREFRALLRAGVRPSDRMAVLGPESQRPRRLHRRLGFYIRLSAAYHRLEVIRGTLSVEEQTRLLKEADPTVLWAYPTVLRSVLLRQDNRLSRMAQPRMLITSGEVFDPVLRDQIAKDCPVEMFNFYGVVEVGRIAAECRAHAGLHIEADAMIVELLNGDRPAAPGEPGCVVVTSLDQYAMPFIRYELGDLCAAREVACVCGWPTPLLDAPMGRNADMVTLPDGSRLSGSRLIFALRAEADLRQFRFVQESADRIEAQLVFPSSPSEDRLEALRKRLEAALGGQARVDIRLMEEIRQEGAKFKDFVSRLPAAQGPADPHGLSSER